MPDTEHHGSDAAARIMIERSPVAALLLDEQGHAVVTNERWGRLTGQPRSASIDDGWLRALDREGRDEFVAAVEAVREQQAGQRGRLRLIGADGQFRWAEVMATPMGDTGTMVTFTDITADRAEARRAAELTRMLEASADLVVALDSTGHSLTWLNQTAQDLLGAEAAVMADHLVEWSQARYLTSALPEVHAQSAWHGELTFVDHQGTEHPMSVLLTSHPDEQGVVDAISLVGRDLGELRLAERRVRAGEMRLAAMVENATDLVCVTDAEGRFVYASPAVGRALGLDPDHLNGVSVLDLVHTNDLERAEATLAEAVGAAGTTVKAELRVSADAETWRHLDIVVTNLIDNPAIGGLVINARDVTDRVAVTQTLTQQAYHDDLTGLPNRAKLRHELDDRLDRAGRAGRRIGVLFLDIDRFKVVNDSLGHAAGDDLLRAVAERLRQAIRPRDLVARLGGDEFVVIIDDLPDRSDALVTAQRLRRAISQPIDLSGNSTAVSTSVGIAIAGPGASLTADELLRDSDTALYRAKEQGRDRAEVFEDDLREQVVRRLETEQQLRSALDGDGIEVHYQPIIDLTAESPIGAEALVRVRGDEGYLNTAHVVAVAEDSGLITRLGQRVLERAVRDLRDATQPGGEPLLVSVNVSARQLAAPRFARSVVRVLDEAGMSGDRLTLEITETTLLEAHPTAGATLRRLADAGVRLALDDFGTGFSSLSHLRRLPIDEVKVDRTFVAGLETGGDDAAIVSATIALAHELDLTIVAEGVETAEQRDHLRGLGAERGQGYLFGKPQPRAEFLSHLIDPPGV